MTRFMQRFTPSVLLFSVIALGVSGRAAPGATTSVEWCGDRPRGPAFERGADERQPHRSCRLLLPACRALAFAVITRRGIRHRALSKLGFSSRAQIAAWAVAKGLAPAPEDLQSRMGSHYSE